jgi:ribosome-binding factor A
MKRSKKWLYEANQLCAELGSEDGIDPRILARKYDSKPSDHKVQQLSKKAKQILSLVLTGELGDPIFQNLDVIAVNASEDGQFLVVTVRHMDSDLALDRRYILNKLQAIQGYLRSVIAQAVKRKHVPTLKFQLMVASDEVSSYAN